MASEDVMSTISSHDLARDIHSNQELVLLLDCRPVFSFSSCHISGAVNINLASVMRKRFMAGKIGLPDLISSSQGKELLQNGGSGKVVVYDESTTDPNSLSSNNTAYLVIMSLRKMGRTPLLLKGGICEFGVLHPSLCEVSVTPAQRSISIGPRATTPGQREQALDWKTAPPVFILSFLVLGSQKDAQSKQVLHEFGVRYILNVTTKCPNYYEDEEFVYKRIAVTDTGTQKLSQHFREAFEFIEVARKVKSCVLIHCMAGISRSVTLTIAYLMSHFGLPMTSAYQYVKERRPAISPNLNFMGQLVEFENCATTSSSSSSSAGSETGGEGKEGGSGCLPLKLEDFAPSQEQDEMSEMMKVRATSSGGSSKESTPEASRNTPEAGKPNEGQKFMLKPLTSNKRKKKKVSPRTSPRILEEAAYLRQGSGEGGREGEGGKLDTQPAINSVSVVRSLGGTAPTVLSQLRRGSVEQAIKSFEKLHTTD